MNFQKSPENLEKLRKSLSEPRFQRYLERANGVTEKAVELYEYNTKASESFYPVLQCLEVTLRNAINEQMVARYGENWLLDQSAPLDRETRGKLQETIDDLLKYTGRATNDDVVAASSFSTWVNLTARKYDSTLWRQAVYRAFMGRGGKPRNQVHARIDSIRRFRNRIAHHECILDKNLEQQHRETIEALDWICPITADWALAQCRFDTVFSAQ